MHVISYRTGVLNDKRHCLFLTVRDADEVEHEVDLPLELGDPFTPIKIYVDRAAYRSATSLLGHPWLTDITFETNVYVRALTLRRGRSKYHSLRLGAPEGPSPVREP